MERIKSKNKNEDPLGDVDMGKAVNFDEIRKRNFEKTKEKGLLNKIRSYFKFLNIFTDKQR